MNLDCSGFRLWVSALTFIASESDLRIPIIKNEQLSLTNSRELHPSPTLHGKNLKFNAQKVSYLECRLINLLGVNIRILRKGFKISKSSSPEMMKSALPQTASSRNLLSFESRHSVIVWSGSTGVAWRMKLDRNCFRSSCKMYGSNLLRHKTSSNSVRVDEEKRMTSCSMPILNAFDGFEPSKSRALMIIFVSKTRRNWRMPLNSIPNKVYGLGYRRPPSIMYRL